MSEILLCLYVRKGCCLCQGLENRLVDLPLFDLYPSIKLRVIDIDVDITSQSERELYDLEVPVMVLYLSEHKQIYKLPRVSPRLKGDELFKWLQKILDKELGPYEDTCISKTD